MLALMRVNLLQGTYTPTLTPMPGVHKGLELTASSVRSYVAPASSSSSGLALARMTTTGLQEALTISLDTLPGTVEVDSNAMPAE